MWTLPRDRFFELVMATLADAMSNAKPGSPIHGAVTGLGEGLQATACMSVARHTQRELRGMAAMLERWMRDPSPSLRLNVVARATEIVRRTLLDLVYAWRDRRYYLDGKPIDLEEFLRDNAESFSAAEVQAVRALRIGDRLIFGGGLAASFMVECKGSANEADHAA